MNLLANPADLWLALSMKLIAELGKWFSNWMRSTINLDGMQFWVVSVVEIHFEVLLLSSVRFLTLHESGSITIPIRKNLMKLSVYLSMEITARGRFDIFPSFSLLFCTFQKLSVNLRCPTFTLVGRELGLKRGKKRQKLWSIAILCKILENPL